MQESAASDHAKRYAPPSQRNRVLNRRKSASGDRTERANNSYGTEVDRSQAFYSRNYHVEAGISNAGNQHAKSTTIPLEGCCSSDASRLLSERWLAAINSCNDPSLDLTERPLIYSGASGSSWAHFRVPHQMDFLAELHRSISGSNIGVEASTALSRSGF